MMKKLFVKLKNLIIHFLKWVWMECKDWRTLVLLGIVCLVLSLPIWAGYIVGFVFHLEWAIVAASAMWAFWLFPGAPFFTVAITITLALKRLFDKKQEKKQHDEELTQEPDQEKE